MKLYSALITCIFFITHFAFADTPFQNQHPEKCGTKAHIEYLKSIDPTYEQRMIDDENVLQQLIADRPESPLDNTIYTIPVVVHVVYFTSGQNISDAQIQSQIDVLNEDYSRMNSDKINTPQAFGTIASTTNFRFCLARRDPAGNPTNGIERRQTTIDTFDIDDNMKFHALGGLDAWDVDRYLNLWVCDLGGYILGYSEPPSLVHTSTFGSVIHYSTFGRIGVIIVPYNLGRTGTHEVGHCLNLKHTFGDDAHCGSPGDYVYDTPDQDQASYGCLTFPYSDACSPNYPGIMFMNYMDYSDDDCANMFTHYQAVRMDVAMNYFYPSLLASNGCLAIGIEEIDDFQFSIYPNPSNGTLNLDMFTTKKIGSSVNVSVTDMLGKKVFESTIQNPHGHVHQLDLKELNNGIYYLSVFNEKYKRTEKILLTR